MSGAPSEHFEFLQNPSIAVSPDEALAFLDYTTIVLHCVTPDHIVERPDLNLRLRGALGRSLFHYGALIKSRADPFNRPTPFEFLYGSYGFFDPRTPFPKPIALRGDIRGKSMTVTMHLLGYARIYAMAAMEAMVQALEGGISLSEESAYRTPIEIDSWEILEAHGLERPQNCGQAKLNFISPLCIRTGQHNSIASKAFVYSLCQRASALMRWVDVDVQFKFSGSVDVDLKETVFVQWKRHSIRQKGTSIPMEGLMNRITLTGDLNALIAPLLICSVFGVGSRASLGLGAYELALYPHQR